MAARTRWWALVVTILALAASAPPASAAYPGANGRLVLTPSSGSGVLIASPRTGRARRVCDAPQMCGTQPARAAFSPNGREIVFGTKGGRLEVTTVTGTCVWCLASFPRVVLHGTSPAFTPGGETITYVNHGLWEVRPGDSHATRLHVITVQVSSGASSAAVWSATGRVAVVRGGWVWTGVRNADNVVLSKRIARGSAPTWSRDGRELAFTRGGFVFTVRTPGHKLTQIARGSAPAFSPDGRALAYLNARHQVTIRSLGQTRNRTRTRTLRRLRGRSLDWQPVTTITRRGCAAANGVPVASTTSATIRQAANPHGGHIGWNGCLTALGIPFHLNGGLDGDGYNLALGQVALAGDYAAMEFIYTDKYMDDTDTVNIYDLRSGVLVHSEPVPCQRLPCRLTSLAVNADGFAVWHSVDTSETPEPNITAISCPTAALCVAGDQSGYLLVSTAPTMGRAAWTRVAVSPASSATPISGISCPTSGLCVAVTGKGTVYTSTDPTGGAAAWQTVSLPGAFAIQAVSCGSVSLCVAVGSQAAYITTDPTGPASAWSAHALSSIPTSLETVSCASSTLCVIGDSAGDLLSSTDPTDPAPSWSTFRATGGIAAVDCPTTGLCVAAGLGGGGGGAIAYTTTDPAANTWTGQQISSFPFPFSMTCAGTSLCLALGGNSLATTTDPADASPSWTQTTTNQRLDAVSCPTTSLCIGAGGSNISTSTDPTGGPSAWNGTLVDALDCDPCLSETLTAVDGHGAHTEDSAPPGPGTHIADLGFTGSTLTWTHDGAARSAALS